MLIPSERPFLLRLAQTLIYIQASGSLNNFTGTFQDALVGGVAGRYPIINDTKVGERIDLKTRKGGGHPKY
jgi:hypothetical protein